MVAISGSIENLVGANVSDFVLIAKPERPFYNGNILIPVDGVRFYPASGNLEFELPETESLEQLIAFSANYTSGGIYCEILFSPVLIPDQPFVALSDLLNPIIA
jgi:hypothetical protein